MHPLDIRRWDPSISGGFAVTNPDPMIVATGNSFQRSGEINGGKSFVGQGERWRARDEKGYDAARRRDDQREAWLLQRP